MVVRGACSYAQALLQREMAVQSLQQRMWHEEVEESCVQGAAAKRRRVAAEEEEREAMRELDRVQAEGPANHRKRDPIDKVPSCRTTPLSWPGWEYHSMLHLACSSPTRIGQSAQPAAPGLTTRRSSCLTLGWVFTCCTLLQATKEAEYRDKVADLKARIDSCTARRNAEQEHEATAKVCPHTAVL